MADYFYGCIYIPDSYITAEVKNKIEAEGLLTEMDDQVNNISSFYDEMARYGMFEELEDFLIENKIPFDRYSSNYCEYLPCRKFYRPATDSQDEIVIEQVTTENGSPFVETRELREILNKEDARTELESLLKKHDPEIPSLNDFSLTGNESRLENAV